MSRAGEEMMVELYGLLNKEGLVATAGKDEKCEKCDKDPCKCKEEAAKEKKKKKEKKEDKKASVVMGVINDLVKLAAELDDLGEETASAAVDDALQVIVSNLKKGN